ncbi:hypothetical protein CDL12_16932 [Handroanthus impetiginosus]|uniref:DUF4005 domain-containing protein n=1 Tax=Handroanthus impetiginosus TaxID=429701 RepID=A0A2G9GYX7_9LAMI|nr:hypothetical protein CDL12_16932 [Handroanthus impetiginosus]
MGKKKSWFTYVKRLFISKPKPKPEEKSKNWRWFLEKFDFKHYPAIESSQIMTLNTASDEQRKHAVAVAIATAAAAEAAVAAANAAAEVVRLTDTPHRLDRETLNLAAITIQTTYRGHLARKALKALKGIVKLQAVIRGELVRRSIAKKLASTYFLEKLQPLVHRRRVPTLLDYLSHGEKGHNLSQKEKLKSEELKLRSNTHRSWDSSLVSKEAVYLRKQEAVAKRELMKQYSFSHRERRSNQILQEIMSLKENRSCRFDQYAEISDTNKLEQLKLGSLTTKEGTIEESNSPFSLPRRSFSQQKSIGDYGSLPDSPVFPAYMGATESAKAKFRSLSTPKRRLRFHDVFPGQNSPYSWSSYNGEMTNTIKRNSFSQQKGIFH